MKVESEDHSWAGEKRGKRSRQRLQSQTSGSVLESRGKGASGEGEVEDTRESWGQWHCHGVFIFKRV